jgi:hypothetical protein
MILHDRALGAGERPGLEQDLVGDPDLPNVMEWSGEADQLAVTGVEAQAARDQGRAVSDALHVLAGLTAAELDGERQPPDRLLARATQLAGPLLHPLLEQRPVVAILELEPPSPEGVGHVDLDLVALERLHEVSVRAELQHRCGELGVVDPGGHQHGDVGVVLADPARQLGARLAGHAHVADDHGETLACEQPACLGGVGGGLALPLSA